MSRNIQTVTKWVPTENDDIHNLFNTNCKELKQNSLNLITRTSALLTIFKKGYTSKIHHNCIQNELNIQELEDIVSSLNSISSSYNSTFQYLCSFSNSPSLILAKIKLWKHLLWKIKLKILYVTQELVNQIAFLFIYHGEAILHITLRISSYYNNLLTFNSKYEKEAENVNVCNNTCPFLMFPLRKISVTRLLQIIATDRAELCCHKLIDCLLETYKLYDNHDDDNGSDNSSLEIYRALTKHMSPRNVLEPSNKNNKNKDAHLNGNETFLSIEELISYEEKNVDELLDIILKVSPGMLGNDGVKKTKHSDGMQISRKAREKVLDYYEQILWGEVGNFLEHVVLWWTASPLSARPPHSSQHLREWIAQFIPAAEVPPVVLSALSSLSDSLGVHVTITSWDQYFRLAVVASKAPYSAGNGKVFCSVLQDLVGLSNQCEVTSEWIAGAPLDELPLVEQIPILHRLDHSIHTTRLWVINETKKLANTWNVDAFFIITHSDVVDCLSQLNSLKFADHTIEIEKGGLGVHVQVCTLMRAKLVSEVNTNKTKLKESPSQCVDVLAKVCRTMSLANLQMIFPDGSYWKQIGSSLPETASPYVEKYLERLLTPVLTTTSDTAICNMILQIMCESWLDHIYINKIKFSQHGACQLLFDFGHTKSWLMNCQTITHTVQKKMLKNEILRRCEGVGRLLLRCPGEQIKMVEPEYKNESSKKADTNSQASEKNGTMPAEMYVPNQEQWLELRAMKRRSLFNPSLCCGKF